MQVIFEQIVNGAVIGCMYALVAVGYTLVFGVLDKLNFAHSEIFMLGGFVALSTVALGAPLLLTLVTVPLACGLVGLAVEFVSFRKFTSRDAQITAALSSLAVGLVIIDLVHKGYGGAPVELPMPTGMRTASVNLLGIQISWLKVAIVGLTLALVAVLHVLITRSAIGRHIRAVAESPTAATLLGINVTRVNQQTFFIASVLAGIAGLLFAARTGFASSDIGFGFALKALAIMAIGGMGDLRGAILGGIVVGVVEALTVHFGYGRFGEGAVWALMIFTLLVRPRGLLGNSVSSEERA